MSVPVNKCAINSVMNLPKISFSNGTFDNTQLFKECRCEQVSEMQFRWQHRLIGEFQFGKSAVDGAQRLFDVT